MHLVPLKLSRNDFLGLIKQDTPNGIMFAGVWPCAIGYASASAESSNVISDHQIDSHQNGRDGDFVAHLKMRNLGLER